MQTTPVPGINNEKHVLPLRLRWAKFVNEGHVFYLLGCDGQRFPKRNMFYLPCCDGLRLPLESHDSLGVT